MSTPVTAGHVSCPPTPRPGPDTWRRLAPGRLRLLLLGALFAIGAGGARPVAAQSGIDGTIRNGTSGGPGRAERVNLIHLRGGMSQVASLAGVEGTFHFDLKEPGPYLVQAQYQGVTYNTPIPPMERGVATPEITVYEATTDTSAIEVSMPHWIVIVDGPKLHVSRVFEVKNTTSPPHSVTGDPGVLRFDLPDGAEAVQGAITSARMPIRQDPIETRDGRGKTIAYALKPGTTRFEIEHQLDYPGEVEIKETLYHGARSIHVIVLPAELTVEASPLVAGGRSERQGVSFLTFGGEDLAPGQVVTLRIRGNARAPRVPGMAGEPAAAGGGVAAGGDATGGGAGSAPALPGEPREVEVEIVRGGRKWLVLGGMGTLLGIALVAGLRRPAPRRRDGEGVQRKATARGESLLDEMAALDEALASGAIREAEHRERRMALKRALFDQLGPARRRKKTA